MHKKTKKMWSLQLTELVQNKPLVSRTVSWSEYYRQCLVQLGENLNSSFANC